MAANNFTVDLVQYNFTATLAPVTNFTVTIDGVPVTVTPPATNIVTATQSVSVVEVVDNGIISILAPSVITVDTFNGNGVATQFQLSVPPVDEENVQVVVGGVVQIPNDSYTTTSTIVNNTLTGYIIFSEAPPAGTNNITARYYSILIAKEIKGDTGPAGPPGNYSTATEIKLGLGAGLSAQYPTAVAIGVDAGRNYQGTSTVAIGLGAGQNNQGARGVAIGYNSASNNPNFNVVAIGHSAGQINAGTSSVSIGYDAGRRIGLESIAIGKFANTHISSITQSPNNTIVINASGDYLPALTSSSTYISPIRSTATSSVLYYNATTKEITYGPASSVGGGTWATLADKSNANGPTQILLGRNSTSSNVNSIAIGNTALTGDGINVAIGNDAQAFNGGVGIGNTVKASDLSVSIGNGAGRGSLGTQTVNIGYNAGNSGQQRWATAIGDGAGQNNQGQRAFALGTAAGQTNQGGDAVALGSGAGYTNQGSESVAIGNGAGYINQGSNAVAIGYRAGYTTASNNTIILNASGSELNGVAGQQNSFYVKPIRKVTSATLPAGFSMMAYNTSTGEIIYWET